MDPERSAQGELLGTNLYVPLEQVEQVDKVNHVKSKKEIVQDDNTTENIRLKKEKLKELKKLKEMLNK